jgi:hypothetical protein
MKRQNPYIGALFTVPLVDGSFAIGQIVGREPQVLNSWTCAFSRTRVDKEESVKPRDAVEPENVIAVQFVTGDLLMQGRWRIYADASVRLPRSDFPYESLRVYEWMGAKMIGSRNIESFLSAYHGLGYWDEMKDPDYYDKLLLPRVKRPDGIKNKAV